LRKTRIENKVILSAIADNLDAPLG
jgi:hypothetical protein